MLAPFVLRPIYHLKANTVYAGKAHLHASSERSTGCAGSLPVATAWLSPDLPV